MYPLKCTNGTIYSEQKAISPNCQLVFCFTELTGTLPLYYSFRGSDTLLHRGTNDFHRGVLPEQILYYAHRLDSVLYSIDGTAHAAVTVEVNKLDLWNCYWSSIKILHEIYSVFFVVFFS